MCNSRHEDSKPIKAEGCGWKIFAPGNRPCFATWDGYEDEPDGFIAWREYGGDGFCFFLTKKEAKRALSCLGSGYRSHSIRKIEYRKGICKQQEDNMTDGVFLIALCKEFRIVE